MIGVLISSTQILALQSPTVRKYLVLGGLLLMEHTGPRWRPLSIPYLAVISTFFFGFLLATMIDPYSVPIRNLVGPASTLYSRTVAPTVCSVLFSPNVYSLISRTSTGPSENLRVSHHKALPSVEVVTHSVPAFENNH